MHLVGEDFGDISPVVCRIYDQFLGWGDPQVVVAEYVESLSITRLLLFSSGGVCNTLGIALKGFIRLHIPKTCIYLLESSFPQFLQSQACLAESSDGWIGFLMTKIHHYHSRTFLEGQSANPPWVTLHIEHELIRQGIIVLKVSYIIVIHMQNCNVILMHKKSMNLIF